MDRNLSTALGELGLSATEAEIYVALLEQAQDGPVSAYRLAQAMGRDPANMTKTLGAMVKRGAVRASGRRPKLYAPVAPVDFTSALIERLQARQREAVKLLEQIGRTPADEGLHPLESRHQVLDVARRLLGEAEHVVLVDAAAEFLQELAADLAGLVEGQGVTVLARSDAPVALDGVRLRVVAGPGTLAADTPGPWLRLTVDGRGCLEAIVHPGGEPDVLFGHWSRNPSQAFLAHRNLGAEFILDDVLELVGARAGHELIVRQADDQAALIQRHVAWRRRWRDAGLPAYRVPEAPGAPEATTQVPNAAEEAVEVDPEQVARAMAELAAEEAEQAGKTGEFAPEVPGATTHAATRDAARKKALAAASDEDDGGPLQFIFRRRRKG